MDQSDLQAALATSLREVAEEHKEAFAETDGYDPDWPLWYAERLVDGFSALLGRRLTTRDVARILVAADHVHRAEAPDEAWEVYYAVYLIDRYVPDLPE